MKKILITCCLLVAYMYISYYLKVHPELTFLQTSITKLDLDMLQSKLPIVILDRIVDVWDVLTSVFKYQYSFIQSADDASAWTRNKHKYLVLKQREDSMVHIAHPSADMKAEDYAYVDLRLKKDQMLVLPYGWWVHAPLSEVYMLDDILSKVLTIF
jgi:hypothetical protein